MSCTNSSCYLSLDLCTITPYAKNKQLQRLERKTSGFLAKIEFTRIPGVSSFFKKQIHKSIKLVYEKIIPSKLRLKNVNNFCQMTFAEKTAGTAKTLFCCKICTFQSAFFSLLYNLCSPTFLSKYIMP